MSKALSISRAQEVELPRALSVLYLNPATDYQHGTQQAKRLVGASGEAASVELPLVLSDAKAKAAAETLLYNAWVERLRYQWATTRKYAHLEPADVVTIDGKVIRITAKEEQPDGRIRWEGVAESSPIYTQAAPGAAAQISPQSVVLAGPTRLELMDIPMLRDADNDAGFYAAAAGYLSGWPGAALYKSADGGLTWAAADTFLTAATLGNATTVLANFTGGNIFDETSLVTVRLLSGTLSSVSELAVLNGGNAALIGSEVVQFKNATLNADGTYTLSGLLRGRRGTEAAMATHAVNERFVLLNTSGLLRIAAGSAEIGLARSYKGVTFGAALADASAIALTNSGAGLKPYSPVHLGGGRNAAGDVTLNWTRRTRIGGEWRDSVDASLGEASESYEVEIWTSGYTTLKRTITGLTTPTASYLSVSQVSDFGSNQATVYFKVFQISATVGRGFEARGQV